MKKFLIILCFAMMISCLMGCDKETTVDNSISKETTTADKEETSVRYAERFQSVSISEAGILYDTTAGLVRLVTIDDGKDMPFCYDPNCSHNPDYSANCMAYIGTADATMYYDGALYIFRMTGLDSHKLYRMETNGAGWESVASLPFMYNISYVCIGCGDKMYYTAVILQEDESTKEISYIYRFVEVDLIDGSYRFVTEESKNTISIAAIAGNILYTRLISADDGRLSLVAIDLSTLESRTVISSDVWTNEYVFFDVYDEDSYFYIGRATREVGIRSIDGIVERVLFRGAENERYSGISASQNGLYYERLYDYEDEPAGHYFMDLVTGEITNITEEAEKYGIMGYDGCYDVFVAREYQERVNDLDYAWSIWSREKVLGEAKE